MASTRSESRPGVSLLEVVIAVAMASTLILATVYEMRQLLWVARQNHQALVADSLAWDVVWRGYNAQGWSMPTAMTNSELSVGYEGSYRLAGAAALARASGGSTPNRVALSVQDAEPLTGSRNRRFLFAEVRWHDDAPVKTDEYIDSSVHAWRLGLSKPAFERSWTRVERDVREGDDATGGGR